MAQFSLFPSLPPEIRHQIWLEALSNADEPGETPLFYFKKGCWRYRPLKPEDSGWHPSCETLCLRFDHDRLDPLRYDHPLFHVNWEARSAARSWARSPGEKEKEAASLLMTRSFDADRDMLYVSEEEYGDFITEPSECPCEAGNFDTFSGCGPHWHRLAVPLGLLKNDPAAFSELYNEYGSVWIVYLIVEAEPDDFWHVQGTDSRERQWWEVQSLEGAPDANFYSDDGSEFLWSGYTSALDRYYLNDVLGPVATEMFNNDVIRWYPVFQIRPARVVRKCI
ncbi:2EXR domain-containing protein [Aspergillus puulaauensis]|uniref:2EXR domain-containing protein n=1 Tax=Aspergillus puulaauensis TaxID=1220207 RepID=A0A7R8ALB2_9EURO|nr:uncharacterized protein APUU_31336S [Aspergillus puulaauensis]BCS23111.1 hypothetical protein APUU_31336S [Aspergillus puulaauensis]